MIAMEKWWFHGFFYDGFYGVLWWFYGGFMVVYGGFMGFQGIYPLVNKQFAIQNCPVEIVDLPSEKM